jgi:hypothetical protein
MSDPVLRIEHATEPSWVEFRRFTDVYGEKFVIQLVVKDELNAQTNAYISADVPGFVPLSELFDEATVEMNCTHDGLGHIRLRVRLESPLYQEPEWAAEGDVVLEAGSLDSAAERVRAFFAT